MTIRPLHSSDFKKRTKQKSRKRKIEEMKEGLMQLRSKANELLLREEWKESIAVYSRFITLCEEQISRSVNDHIRIKFQKPLSLAFSNRAEALFRMRNWDDALKDCEQALKFDRTHLKTLICKGKILLEVCRYSEALGCFKQYLENQTNGSSEVVRRLMNLSKQLVLQSATGNLDLSNWILNGFKGQCPNLADYIGPIEIKRSENGGRGMFVTKNVESGTVLLINKAVAIGRAILPENRDEASETSRLVMWKDFLDRVFDICTKSSKTLSQIYTLSTGEEEGLEVPDLDIFRPEINENVLIKQKPDMDKLLKILDVNSQTEDSISARILGKNCDFQGIGLWILASFINHSCNPNSRRLQVGDHLIIHASRSMKAGDEITYAYFDVLTPLTRRKEMMRSWGFECHCIKCRFEEEIRCEELIDLENELQNGSDMGGAVVRLEDTMRRLKVKGKSIGFLRASFWSFYSEVYISEKLLRRWGSRIPAVEAVAKSVTDSIGGDERVVGVMVNSLKRNNGGGVTMMEIEKVVQIGRAVYGKVMNKKAMKILLHLENYEWPLL